MSQGWRSQAAPGSLRPVYGAQFPPLGQAVGGPETGTASSPAKSNGDKAAAETARFRDFAARVEDAWEVEDESLVQRTAEQVLANHRTAVAAHPRRGHPAHSHLNLAHNALPSQHSKQRAMQLLATQKEPLPGTAVPLGGYEHEPGTSCRGLYPNLPQLNANLINREGGKGVPDSGGPQGPGPASIRALQRNSSSGEKELSRYERLEAMLSSASVDVEGLRKECWKGIPHKLRPRAWKLLLGYTPLAGNKDAVLHRKRAEYWDYVSQYFHTRYEDHHADTFRQIHIDIPRMCPLIPLFQQKRVQEIFERILYIWAIRHPACGYVQGINDLVTPFFVVFLSDNLSDDVEVSTYLVSNMEQEVINAIEADSFWCVSALLDTIQDNYTFAQPGIQHKIAQLSHLMSRVDRSLDEHLEKMQVEYLQFAFRWMNNLLMRELPLGATIRLWDTYLCESGGGGRAFADFHVYVCAAFLRVWSKQLQQHKDFQGVMLLLQNLPTAGWRDREICELTADAFSLMTLFAGSKNHLTSQT